MISPVEFISSDHRPAEFSPQVTELEGPPFGEYLARAETERSNSADQRETEKTDADLQGGSSGRAEESKDAEAVKDAAAQSKKEETDTPENSKKADRDHSGEGSDDSVSRDEKDNPVHVPAPRGDDRPTTEKNSRKVNNPENVFAAARGADKVNKSDVKIQTPVQVAAGKDPEKSASSERRTETSDSDARDKEKSAIKGFTVSGEGIGPGDAESAKEAGKPAAEKTRHDSESRRDASAVRRVHSGDDAHRPTVKAEVIDLRSRKETKSEQAASHQAQKIEGVGMQDSLKPEGQNRQDFIVIEASQGKADSAVPRSETGPAQAAADLSRALKEEGNGEIIKKAQFVLKDRDQGEIRLILKPEKLGEVRIRLNLSDNRHIAGRIIVENNSVREVFQENMEALNRAFRENGFQTAGLDVSVGQREGFSGRRREQNLEGLPLEKMTRIFDDQVPRVEDYIFGESRVNVYV